MELSFLIQESQLVYENVCTKIHSFDVLNPNACYSTKMHSIKSCIKSMTVNLK